MIYFQKSYRIFCNVSNRCLSRSKSAFFLSIFAEIACLSINAAFNNDLSLVNLAFADEKTFCKIRSTFDDSICRPACEFRFS